MTEDIQQAVLERFLSRAQRGWFNEAPRVSREAQVRTLLSYCLLQEQKARIGEASRERHIDHSFRGPEDDDDPLDRIATTAPSPLDLQLDHEALTALLPAVRVLGNPSRRLAILGLFLPHELLEVDLIAASRHVIAGRRFLVREPGAAWALVEQALAARSPEDATSWRRTFAEILRFDVALGEPVDELVDNAVNALEKQVERGLGDLRCRLAGIGEDAE